jgi:quercetin dioxygenase-like cupin family protein
VKRREFMTLLGGAAVWPLVALAQQAGKLTTIGYLARTRLDRGSQDGQGARPRPCSPAPMRSSNEPVHGGQNMRICSLISHTAIGCGGLIGGWLVAVGQLGIMPSFAQAPAASSGQRSTELFNRVMDDVLGRRLTVRLTERDPENGSAAHRHPGSHTVGYILEGSYEVKINDGPVQTLKSGEVFYEPPNALHAISRNASMEQPVRYLVIQVSDPTKPATVPE